MTARALRPQGCRNKILLTLSNMSIRDRSLKPLPSQVCMPAWESWALVQLSPFDTLPARPVRRQGVVQSAVLGVRSCAPYERPHSNLLLLLWWWWLLNLLECLDIGRGCGLVRKHAAGLGLILYVYEGDAGRGASEREQVGSNACRCVDSKLVLCLSDSWEGDFSCRAWACRRRSARLYARPLPARKASCCLLLLYMLTCLVFANVVPWSAHLPDMFGPFQVELHKFGAGKACFVRRSIGVIWRLGPHKQVGHEGYEQLRGKRAVKESGTW